MVKDRKGRSVRNAKKKKSEPQRERREWDDGKPRRLWGAPFLSVLFEGAETFFFFFFFFVGNGKGALQNDPGATEKPDRVGRGESGRAYHIVWSAAI